MFYHLLSLIVKSGIIPSDLFINPSFIGNTNDEIFVDIPDNMCAGQEISIPLDIPEENYEISVSDNLTFHQDNNNNLNIQSINPVGIDAEGWIKITVPFEDECKSNKVYNFEIGIHNNIFDISSTFSVNAEDCSIDIIARSWGTLPDYEINILDFSVSPEYIGNVRWFFTNVQDNVLHIDIDESLQGMIEFPEYIDYTITVNDPCGNEEVITNRVYLPDCTNEDDPIFIITPNPSNTNTGFVTIKIRSNTIRNGNIYIQNVRGLSLVGSNYVSNSNPSEFLINSIDFEEGVNYIIFTDNNTFGYSEPLIKLK